MHVCICIWHVEADSVWPPDRQRPRQYGPGQKAHRQDHRDHLRLFPRATDWRGCAATNYKGVLISETSQFITWILNKLYFWIHYHSYLSKDLWRHNTSALHNYCVIIKNALMCTVLMKTVVMLMINIRFFLLFCPGFVNSSDLPAHRNPWGHCPTGRPHML